MRQALEMALEALEVASSCIDGYYIPKGKTHLPEVEQAITAIKEALAQPEQDDGMCTACENDLCTAKQGCVALDNPQPVVNQSLTTEQEPVAWMDDGIQIYKKPWVSLTEEEIHKCIAYAVGGCDIEQTARNIEAKLKGLNHD